MRIADGDPVKLARMLEIQSWFGNKDQDSDIHGQISATERKGGDTPEGSHAGVHRAAPLGHGANRFTESNREGVVVGVSIPDGVGNMPSRQ